LSFVRIVELEIEDIAFGGKGVGRVNGKAVFVPFTIDGESISAQIVRDRKQFAEAEVVDLQRTSRDRVEPECPYFGRCGGCAYQHIAYEHQLAIKWRQVRDVLQRIGKMNDVPMRPIIPSAVSYAYRNRITVHAQDGVIGFFGRHSHRLLDIERCPIATEEVNRALGRLRAGRVRDGHYTLRAHVDRLYPAPLSDLTTTSPTAQKSARLGEENALRPFSQINDAVANAMRDWIASLIPPDQELLIDAYCGAGFFAKALLDKFERIIGIDWDKFAIAAAEKTATSKETYIAGDVDEVLSEMARKGAPKAFGVENHRFLTLIVDPPATGLTPVVRKSIADLAPAMLIYISCNPSTLARDLAELQKRFVLESVTPLDMFPQTAEIEAVAQLRSGRLSSSVPPPAASTGN
jgi:tRNA/tmRNA/rRNA uracil-C5-methylase (TrmA/RlmC/RlmD family)